ncbi:MAG: LON peptidase substrate-binding domain-containing protein [Planctomycetota bacterium]|nr:LON peptidase substrate-binding domain-containing protein [Planctomycetota bacterium]
MNLEARPRILPLFPLPDVILFPGQILPLHIFESRYRQMTRDLLDNAGEIILGTVLGKDKERLQENAPVQPIACQGRLQQYQTLEDGRFLVMILGEKRVRIHPHIGNQLYPEARIEDLVESSSFTSDQQTRSLQESISELKNDVDLPEDTSAQQLSDILIMITPMSTEQRYRLFSTPSLADRVELILEMQPPSDKDAPDE